VTTTFEQAWLPAPVGVRRSLELAHAALVAGGLPVGAVILGEHGEVLAEGRNRAYDPPGGTEVLQGTPIAHAEMNALAALSPQADPRRATLWSSHRPCAMCAAAIEFVQISEVRFVAPDPSEGDHSDPVPVEHSWAIVANLLFLAGIRGKFGATASMITRAADFEPEVVILLCDVAQADLCLPTLRQVLQPLWARIDLAAQRRSDRLSP
jgi:tRNA(Arg) A34 adenosine deaminase TadA